MDFFDPPIESASSSGPDTMIYKCIYCQDVIVPLELHMMHGPTKIRCVHIACLPDYLRNWEEVDEREDKKEHLAYWRYIRKEIRTFLKMKKKLQPKLHRLTKSRT